MNLESISALLAEIEYLKKSNDLLDEVSNALSPYDKEINGKSVGNLAQRISEHLTGFDDSE